MDQVAPAFQYFTMAQASRASRPVAAEQVRLGAATLRGPGTKQLWLPYYWECNARAMRLCGDGAGRAGRQPHTPDLHLICTPSLANRCAECTWVTQLALPRRAARTSQKERA